MQFGNLYIDPLAVAALGGFAVLILIFLILTVWFIWKASKGPGEL